MGEVEMGSLLKQKLKSLCCSTGWSYGALWRFHQTNPMLLTMEEAYCEEKSGPLIDNMLLKFHLLGKGIIGQAALNGKHQWIFTDSPGEDEESSRSIADQTVVQDRCEFQSQFLSGIKTIAVISMESQGVLQLGSTQKILERLEFIDQTKKLFCEEVNVFGLIVSENVHSSWNCFMEPMEKEYCSRISTSSLLPEIHDGSLTSLQQNLFQFSCQFQPFPTEAEVLQSNKPDTMLELQADIQSTSPVDHAACSSPCLNSWSSEASVLRSFESQLLSENGRWHSPDVLFDDGLPNNVASSLQGLSMEFEPVEFTLDFSNSCALDDLSRWFSPSPEHNHNQPGTTTTSILSVPIGVTLASAGMFGSDAQSDDSVKHVGNLVQTSNLDTFTFDGEDTSVILNVTENSLFEGLGVDFNLKKFGKYLEDINQPVIGSCSPVVHAEMSECMTELNAESMNGSQKGFISKQGLEDILDGGSNYSTVTDVEHQFSATKRRKTESSSSYFNQAQNMDLSCLDGSLNCRKNSHNWGKTRELPPKSQVGSWINDSYSINVPKAVASASMKPESPVKSKKKRARPGESTRPRPKDRQMIQDRIKELRGLIPHGGKCPIDALLDRTIKYMVFLQSAMKHVDKLKHADKPKMICQESGVILKDNIDDGISGGATWAIEVGDQLRNCPIIVQDLNPPGQMLIEMICQDQGFFLEIADTIRGLGLNIFRGMMEIQETKIWARFIVEASSGVTRQEVFCYLLSVLQEPATCGMDSTHVQQEIDRPSTNNYQQPLLLSPVGLADILQ